MVQYSISNQNHTLEVSVVSLNAAIQSVKLKDRTGKVVDVVLGFDTLDEYIQLIEQTKNLNDSLVNHFYLLNQLMRLNCLNSF